MDDDACSTDPDQWTPEPASSVQFVQPRQCEYIEALICEWIMFNHHEFNIVEQPEFKKLLKYLLPAYEAPGREVIGGRLMNELKQRTENKVHKV